MLPEGWKRVALGEIAQISSGGTPDRSEPRYWSGDIPWVTTGEIQFNTITDTTEKITRDGLKNSSAKLFPSGTLLMAMYGQGKTRGQVAKLGIEAATNQACAAIQVGDEGDKEYVYQFLANHYKAIRELGNAGTQQNLNAGLIKAIDLPLPPKREQARVAEIALTWDSAIAATEKLLVNSRRQKRDLMQALLLKSVDLQELLPLYAISERVQRTSDGAKHPVLMISSGMGFVRQDEKYSRFMAGKSLNDYVLLKRGEFAYNKGNSKLYEFGCVFPLEDYERGLVPHVYVCFKLDERCAPDYFKYLFEADYLHDQLGALVNTGVRNNGLLNIRPADFMNVTVPVPSMARQKYIADVLTAASSEIKLLQKDLDALRLQKRALMADLLTGKRRVRMLQSTAQREAV
jgi:type I restriction enzyme S subunit